MIQAGSRVHLAGCPDLLGDVEATREWALGLRSVLVAWDKRSLSGRRYGREGGYVVYREEKLVDASGALCRPNRLSQATSSSFPRS